MMAETAARCLVVFAQFEQAQLPPQAHPPEVEAFAAPPITAKVENMALVLVLSHSGQTWHASRLA
jgi:hypothetical protein